MKKHKGDSFTAKNIGGMTRIVLLVLTERLEDHYWDSLTEHKELIMKHIRDCITNWYGEGGK